MNNISKHIFIIAYLTTTIFAQEIPPPVYIEAPPHVTIDGGFSSPPYEVNQIMAVGEIDNDSRLDWVTLYNRRNPTANEYLRYGNWRKNISNTNFDVLQSAPYLNETFTTDHNFIYGAVFAKLRNSDRKDLVVVRNGKIQIYQNQNYSLALYQDYTSFSGLAVDTGDFNQGDNYNDIIVLNQNNITVYKNNYDGTISSQGWSFGFDNSNGNLLRKIKATQINNKVYPYSLYLPEDKVDIITMGMHQGLAKIRVANNNNNNNFEDPYYIYPEFHVTDFEVVDVTNDGWNDLIVTGNNILKIYLNENGTISSTPAYTNTTYVTTNPKIAIGDFNKDGYNDLCVLLIEQQIRLWINNQTSSLFPSVPTESIGINGNVQGSYTDFEAIDFSNMGGLGVADIFLTGGSFTIYTGGANRFNAVTWDKNPSPPIIFGDLLQQGGFNRPRLTIYNRGDRDLLNNLYLIYKKRPGDLDYNYLGQTEGSNVYIDYTENVYGGKGVPVNGQSVNYKVKAVDLTSNHSIFSNNALYWIDGDPPDNMLEGIYANTPERYFVANYPNPFNPSAKIYYSLPDASNVKIVVFNSIGQEIRVLVDKFHDFAGNYEITFDGSNIASGLYFYSIEITKEGSMSSSFREVKKMVLLK